MNSSGVLAVLAKAAGQWGRWVHVQRSTSVASGVRGDIGLEVQLPAPGSRGGCPGSPPPQRAEAGAGHAKELTRPGKAVVDLLNLR
jgi:hypothetical protein